MQVLPPLRSAVAAVAAALDTPIPAGRVVYAAAYTAGGAAWQARYPLADAEALFSLVLGPVLGARHPGELGEWLWERVLRSARAGYAAERDQARWGVGA